MNQEVVNLDCLVVHLDMGTFPLAGEIDIRQMSSELEKRGELQNYFHVNSEE